jgi:N-acetylneuraminic acid mutarotase
MKIVSIYLLFIFLIILSSCDKDAEIGGKDYPYLITNEVTDITDMSVVFNGEIISTGEKEEITEYGFLWGTNEPKLDNSNKVVIKVPIKTGGFSVKIDYNLYKDTEQTVRAYIKTNNLIVYGNEIKFTCNGGIAAEISEINPLKGYVNSKVVIKGNNFGNQLDKVKVYFGDIEAEIDSCTDNRIVVKVPDIDSDIEECLAISVYNKQVISSDKFRAFTYWKKIANFPGSVRYDAAFFNINGKGFVGAGTQFDGNYLNDFYEYDPVMDRWSRKADYPGKLKAGRIGFTVNNFGYIGFGNSQTDLTSDLWQYDPQNDNWTEITVETVATEDNTNFVIDNRVYIIQFGIIGYNAELNEIFWREPLYNNITPMYSTGTSLNGKGYVIARYRPEISTSPYYLWEFKPQDRTWTRKAAIPGVKRYDMVLFAINNQLYAGLGRVLNGSGYTAFYSYDYEQDIWNLIEDFPGESRKSAVCFVIDNKAYIGTGKNDNSIIDFFEFNPLKN